MILSEVKTLVTLEGEQRFFCFIQAYVLPANT